MSLRLYIIERDLVESHSFRDPGHAATGEADGYSSVALLENHIGLKVQTSRAKGPTS